MHLDNNQIKKSKIVHQQVEDELGVSQFSG